MRRITFIVLIVGLSLLGSNTSQAATDGSEASSLSGQGDLPIGGWICPGASSIRGSCYKDRKRITYSSRRTLRVPSVLCYRSWSPESRFLTRLPRSCDTHWRGRVYDAASFQRFSGLRWRKWGPTYALARGRLFQNMAGWKKVHIKLSRPVKRCGRDVFSRVSGRVYSGGSMGWIRFSIPISLC